MRVNPNFTNYGGIFHDKVVKALARSAEPSSPLSVSFVESDPLSDITTRAQAEYLITRLLAMCACTDYQNMLDKGKGWFQHLNEFDKLLTFLGNGGLFFTDPQTHKIFNANSQRGLRAAFWWWTINDLEESFVSCREVRVDIGDVSLWRYMGLQLEDDGAYLIPDSLPNLPEEKMSFALIRLVCKVVNLVAQSEWPTETMCGNSSSVDTEFGMLREDLEVWEAGSAPTFMADCSLDSPECGDQYADLFGCDIWYNHPSKAVTMLYYHMTRSLVLIHQPPNSLIENTTNRMSSLDLLLALRDVESRLRKHAFHIISITNGMQRYGAVRARSLQPLYVAGRSLTVNHDRQCLVKMMRSIQHDLGVACEYRVENLIEEWKTSLDALGLPTKDT